MKRLTVVVPAHNEEALIATTLRRLLDAADALEVIVVANGCTDRTAQRAREVGGPIRVLEIAEASKIAALNAAHDLIRIYPVVYVDADVSVTGTDLLSLADGLHAQNALVAAPKMTVLPSSSWWVRQHYAVWELTDYRATGHIGSGIYMLSSDGRARFSDFPPVIADDLFVQRLFAPRERYTPDDVFFSVASPGSLSALVKRNTRIAAGNQQLALHYPEMAPPVARIGARTLARRVWRRPELWLGFAGYTAVHTITRRRAARLLSAQHAIAWNRDESSRQMTP